MEKVFKKNVQRQVFKFGYNRAKQRGHSKYIRIYVRLNILLHNATVRPVQIGMRILYIYIMKFFSFIFFFFIYLQRKYNLFFRLHSYVYK